MKFSNLVLGLALIALPVSAFAGNEGEHDQTKYPVPAAEFRAKVTARQTKHREHLEKKIALKKIPADRAKEMRDRMAASEARVNAKVSDVIKDGTVTEDEAKQVREVARAGRRHHEKTK